MEFISLGANKNVDHVIREQCPPRDRQMQMIDLVLLMWEEAMLYALLYLSKVVGFKILGCLSSAG